MTCVIPLRQKQGLGLPCFWCQRRPSLPGQTLGWVQWLRSSSQTEQIPLRSLCLGSWRTTGKRSFLLKAWICIELSMYDVACLLLFLLKPKVHGVLNGHYADSHFWSVKIFIKMINGSGFFLCASPPKKSSQKFSVYIEVYLCVESYRRPLCILRHFMSVVKVVGEGWLLVFVHQIWVGGVCSYSYCQQTMYYNICIPVQESRWTGRRAGEGRGLDGEKKGTWMA